MRTENKEKIKEKQKPRPNTTGTVSLHVARLNGGCNKQNVHPGSNVQEKW